MDPVPADSDEAIEDLPSPLTPYCPRPELIDGTELVRRLGEHGGIELRFLDYCEGPEAEAAHVVWPTSLGMSSSCQAFPATKRVELNTSAR